MMDTTTAKNHSRPAAAAVHTITRRIVRLMTTSVLMLGLGWSSASAQPPSVVDVPHNLRVPGGNEAFLTGYALGTQNYVCLGTSAGVAWKFLGPQATLFLTSDGYQSQQITTHYLSVNPAESLARPTWQHSLDTSRFWGRVKESSKNPDYVAPGAIDWLLLERAGAQFGPTGGSILTQTTFIQRVNTSGGVAPTTGCSDISHVGTLALVPYSTDYVFYRSSRDK